MIHRELSRHPHHYSLLIVIESVLLSLFLTQHDSTIQFLLAFLIGIFYFGWGIMTHAGEVKPLRLMLEYAVVGLLASTMLTILVSNI
jgi:hypothetical protein